MGWAHEGIATAPRGQVALNEMMRGGGHQNEG